MNPTPKDPGASPFSATVLKLDNAEPGRGERLRALEAEMVAYEVTPDGPSRLLLSHLGERWSVFLLYLLSTGRYRHAEVRRIINGFAPRFGETQISARVLTERLRDLERDGFVRRHVGSGKLPPVDYTLTPIGQSLMVPIRALMDWSASHGNAMRDAQHHFDAHNDVVLPGVHRMRR